MLNTKWQWPYLSSPLPQNQYGGIKKKKFNFLWKHRERMEEFGNIMEH